MYKVMANWTVLKAAIANVIKTNGNQTITGQLLQNVLNDIVSSVGENSTFAGIATPATNPGVPDGNIFYLATEAGIYANFNGIEIATGEAVILEWRGSWVKKTSGFATQQQLSEMESRFQVSPFLNNKILNSLLKEIYISGKGFDKTHRYHVYAITRNYGGIGWAIAIKDINTQVSTGWIVLSSSEELKGYIKATSADSLYTVEVVISNWDLINKAIITFSESEGLLSGNQFDINFSPTVKNLRIDSEVKIIDTKTKELDAEIKKINPNIVYTENIEANRVINMLFIDRNRLEKDDIALYYLRRNFEGKWKVGFKSVSDGSYIISATSDFETPYFQLIVENKTVGIVDINWSNVLDKQQTIYNALLTESAYNKSYYLSKIEELESNFNSFYKEFEEAFNEKINASPYAYNSGAEGRNLVITNTDAEHSVYCPANLGIIYGSRMGCKVNKPSSDHVGKTVHFELTFIVKGIDLLTENNFDIFINDSKKGFINPQVVINSDKVTISVDRVILQEDANVYSFFMQMKNVTNSQTFSKDIKFTYFSENVFIKGATSFSDFVKNINEILDSENYAVPTNIYFASSKGAEIGKDYVQASPGQIIYGSRFFGVVDNQKNFVGKNLHLEFELDCKGIEQLTLDSYFQIYLWNSSDKPYDNKKLSFKVDRNNNKIYCYADRIIENTDTVYKLLLQITGASSDTTYPNTIRVQYSKSNCYVEDGYNINSKIKVIESACEELSQTSESILNTAKMFYSNYAAMKHITVKTDGSGDFTSIQEAINSITDASVVNQYDIQVFDDIIIDNMSDMWKNSGASKVASNEYQTPPSCAIFFTKDWVHVRGMGAMKKIIFKCPSNVQDNYEQKIQCIYPKGNSSLDNFYIEIDRGRYAIHQESGDSKTHPDYNATTLYKNLIVRHKGLNNSWTSTMAQANGTTSGLTMIYDHVTWISDKNAVPFYTHTNTNFDSPNTFIFKSCRMLSGLKPISTFGVDDRPGIYDLGSGWKHNVYIEGCDFPKFYCRNKIYGAETKRGYADNIDAGGCNIMGTGNSKQIINVPLLSILHFEANEVGKEIKVIGGTAYNDIWGETYKSYIGSDIKGQIFGRKRIELADRGKDTSYIFTLAYRLGNCFSNNKTLILEIDGQQKVITFNKNYMTADGSAFSPTTISAVSDSTIINDINSVISDLATASIDAVPLLAQTYDDCKISVFNLTDSTFKMGAGLIYDYNIRNYRLCVEEEQPDVIAAECICVGEFGEAIKPDKVILHKNIFSDFVGNFTISGRYGFTNSVLVQKEDGIYKAIREDAILSAY